MAFLITDVFRDQRLVIAVTHFDIAFEAHDQIPADEIKQKVCTMIKSAVGESFPQDLVIPVCSRWAQYAQQLRYSPSDENAKTTALKFLDDYDEDPRGQAEGIESLDPVHIADRLEKASGILEIEQRYVFQQIKMKVRLAPEMLNFDLIMHFCLHSSSTSKFHNIICPS